MRLILFYTFLLLGISAYVSIAQPYMKLFEKAPESLHLWNTADWAFLNRYLIERTLMSPPTVFELSSSRFSKNIPSEISILSKIEANGYLGEWVEIFFKKEPYKLVEENILPIDKNLVILGKYPIHQVNNRELFLKNMNRPLS